MKTLAEFIQEKQIPCTIKGQEDTFKPIMMIPTHQAIEQVKEWLEATRKHWKGNNLCAHSEFDTIDWAIDELLEDLSTNSSKPTTEPQP